MDFAVVSLRILVCIFLGVGLHAQSIILELEGGDSGMIVPRTDTNQVSTPVKGLLILDMVTMTFFVYDGNNWRGIPTLDDFQFYYADRDGDLYGDKYTAIYAPIEPLG
jgi:hypothetical protein